METVVAIEDNDDGKLEDSGVDRSSSALSSPKPIANPVVYKLVRVLFQAFSYSQFLFVNV